MRRAAAVVLVSLLVGPIVASTLWNVDELLGIGLAGATLVLVAVLLIGRPRGAASGRGDWDAGEGDGWLLVPEWQYEGRFAEAGGISRSEQDRALREVDERAEEERARERG